MNRVLPYVLTLTLAVWLGGLVTLILFVSVLFVKARALAADAAPILFSAFETFQLALAAITLLSVVLWRWTGRSRLKTLTLVTTLMATLLAVVQIGVVTPRINASRHVNRPMFDRYHRLASTNYTTITAFVLLGLVLSLAAARRPAGRHEAIAGQDAASPNADVE